MTRNTEMSQVARIEISSSEQTARAPIANHNFVIAAALLGIAVLLVATQWIYVENSPDAIEAATMAAAIGIIAP